MSSRDAILARLRNTQSTSVSLPDYGFERESPNLKQQFTESLQFVGGVCVSVADAQCRNDALEQLQIKLAAKNVLSRVDGVAGSVDQSQINDPHQLAAVDLAILPGVFGVAENGAVWLDMNCLGPHRAAFVIPQHLALVLQSHQIVATMHDAYKRFDLNDHNFGVFISGPSKTADIEQSLVVGAHGARSCTVFLIG